MTPENQKSLIGMQSESPVSSAAKRHDASKSSSVRPGRIQIDDVIDETHTPTLTTKRFARNGATMLFVSTLDSLKIIDVPFLHTREFQCSSYIYNAKVAIIV